VAEWQVPARVLVVDDEKNITLVVQAMLERAGFEVTALNDSSRVAEALDEEEFHAVLSDLQMPGLGGMEILAHCKAEYPELPVVILTAYGTVENAVQALKAGAFDFVTKPFDQQELLDSLTKAVQTCQARRLEPLPITPWTDAADGASDSAGAGISASSISSIIGASPSMQEVFRVIAKVAPTSSTVMIYGESGTGKELVAQEIHRHSPRAKKSFVKINCAAIPANLIESELFGHERGAFTGAVSSKPGRFELAHEGTILLDEVAEMPLEMQVKLLRVLQEQEFTRVGGLHPIRVDVRIVTATNKDLEAEVKAGRFREDLFYRLNVVPVRLPPLRERREDVEALVRIFIQEFSKKLKVRISSIEPACLESLKQHAWPGNIRQLENVIERMVLMADSEVLRVSDLPVELRPEPVSLGVVGEGSGESSFKETVRLRTQAVERELIEKALEELGGNVTRTAEKLGISRKGLQLKMKELGVRRHGTSEA